MKSVLFAVLRFARDILTFEQRNTVLDCAWPSRMIQGSFR